MQTCAYGTGLADGGVTHALLDVAFSLALDLDFVLARSLSSSLARSLLLSLSLSLSLSHTHTNMLGAIILILVPSDSDSCVQFAGTLLRYQVPIPERISFPTQVSTRNDVQR